MTTELREHVAVRGDVLTCFDCARPIRPGASYFAPWVEVPAPVDPDGDEAEATDYVSDADSWVLCRTCVATSTVLDADPDDEPPPRPKLRGGPPQGRTQQHAAPRAPSRPVPPRRRRRGRWSLALAAVVAALVVVGVPNLQSQNGCPSGTERLDTGTVSICDRPDGTTVCQIGPDLFGGWTWPECPASSGAGSTFGRRDR